MARRNNKKLIWTGVIVSVVLIIAIAAMIFYKNDVIVNEYINNAELGLVTLKITTLNWLTSTFSIKQTTFDPWGTVNVGSTVQLRNYIEIGALSQTVGELKIDLYKDGSLFTTVSKVINPPIQPGAYLSSSISWTANTPGTYTVKTYIRHNALSTWSKVTDPSESTSYGKLTVVDEPECDSHDYQACGGDDLYWYDTCGEQEDVAQQCENGCQNNQCEEPEPVCTEGAEQCSEFSLEVCSNNAWDPRGIQIDKCEVTCIDNADCSANYVCNVQYTCEPSGGCPTGQTLCSDGTCKTSCDEPNPMPWIIIFILVGILLIGVIIFVVWKLRR